MSDTGSSAGVVAPPSPTAAAPGDSSGIAPVSPGLNLGPVVIDLGQIADRLGLPLPGIEAVVSLLDAGNTVPFITRYRRDQTGGLDELDIRRIEKAIAKARQLADRKQTILRTIDSQGKLTDQLSRAIAAAESSKQLEDLYLPFKPRKLSLAEIARQRRLEPLAREILEATVSPENLDRRAADFVDADGQVATAADALLGVGHILADTFSERAEVRQRLRSIMHKKGHIRSQRVETEGKALSKAEKHYRDYFDYSEHVQRVPPHRALAINRGERAKLLKVRIEAPVDEMQAAAEELMVPAGHPHGDFLRGCVRDSISRLIQPSLERELRREITDWCETHAVDVFAKNLRNLLLQPPVVGRRVLALDPGFKSGCKAVVIDECGNPLENAILHIIGKKEKREEAGKKIVEMVTTHAASVIAIGNGTAGRETESLVVELVAGELKPLDVGYAIVNEAGASVYSTSELARNEFPQHEASARGAISIGRRLQDPLSELVKIEPANIGVGLYQHDVKARHLHASLDAVVESCVNYVGVDVNTASPALLRYVSGLNQTMAKGFHEWRLKNGPFTSRRQLLEVPGFGEAAFVQAVGFLKITGGDNPLDATWIHPESYAVAEKVLERLGFSPADLANRQQADAISEKAAGIDLAALARELGVGRLLLTDIIEQLRRPGRDPREDLPKPFFKKGVLKLEDLEVGMELLGSVLNVVDFGAFVDIGLHDSGLVHISQLSSRYVSDPHDVVSVGQIVKVWVLELDKARRRVALTMIDPDAARLAKQQRPQPAKGEGRPDRARRAKGDASQQQPKQQAGSQDGGRRSDDGRGRRPQAAGRGQQRRTDRREPQGRVYTSKPGKAPPAPLSKEMREGKKPLRTFGDLRQFFLSQQQPADERPVDDVKHGNQPGPVADEPSEARDATPEAKNTPPESGAEA